MNKLKIAVIAAAALATFAASPAGASTHHKAKVRTVTKIVYRNVTPASCITAINDYRTLGSQLATLLGDYAGEFSPLITDMENSDVAGINQLTSQVSGWNNQLTNMYSAVTAANVQAATCEG